MFYHTKGRAAASDFKDGGRVVDGFAVLVGARVDEDEVARSDLTELGAVIADDDPCGRVTRGDVRFASDEEIDAAFGLDLLDGFLVAGEPVVGLVDAERAARPADEGVVVGVFVGMELRRAEDAWKKQGKNYGYA